MRPELVAIAERYGVPLRAVAEIEALVASSEGLPGSGLGAGPSAPTFLETASTAASDGGSEAGATTDPQAPTGWAEASTLNGPPLLPAGARPRGGLAWGGADRYEDLGPLGRGGMGEVRRVRDRVLQRVLARKVAHGSLAGRPRALERFVQEAQATAQLQHPGIVPVHDLGQLPDGRTFFTMKEVQGRTLAEVIREVHLASGEEWQVAPSGWSLRRLVTAVHAACQAMAYAHERGVIHRDLKPGNLMVGRHGEVYVLDWGLARVQGGSGSDDGAEALEAVRSSRSSELATQVGQVSGTPAYMPPEQARGEVDRVDARSDVYALGAVLYEVLSGQPPFSGDAATALAGVLSGPPAPLGRSGPPLPGELIEVCERAMAREPEQRFPTAEALGRAVQEWLDGSRRREQALAVVEEAADQAPRAAALRAEARALREAAKEALRRLPPWSPEDEKAEAWAQEDTAADLERLASLAELAEETLLGAALTHAPELPEAHAALAGRYLAELRTSEDAQVDAHRAETLLRQHAAALPASHPVRLRAQAFLEGESALTLLTDPPGAEVLLFRYEVVRRRRVPVFVRSLGPTPLAAVRLPRGSYLCELRHPDREVVRYPVFLGREEHWDGVPPEGGGPLPILLPRPGELGPDDCYLPAGWFWSGGDPKVASSLPRRRLWVDAEVFRRFPVTNQEFIAFLDDLVARGRVEEALRQAPRERAGTEGVQGALIYAFDGARFSLRTDADGDRWTPDLPVLMTDWDGACAFAAWEADRTGQPWRLPTEIAWEKAARGADGRWLPWGDVLDPSWACMRDSHPGRPGPAPVRAFPVDESVYGVRGMAGNVRDWCLDVFLPEGPPVEGGRARLVLEAEEGARRVFRGGSWFDPNSFLRIANRSGLGPAVRSGDIGFRLARPLHRGS